MEYSLAYLPYRIDGVIILCLLPLAVWILLSGLDDLVVALAYLYQWARTPPPPSRHLSDIPEKRIAVFIPCWREHHVISEMVEHNLSAIRYRDYALFIGAYPNDDPTLRALRELEGRYRNVHISLCPHDGPTSKADCLNWIYQRMLVYEEEHSSRFDVVVTHDAEDLIHPESLRLINCHADSHDMVQIPVLPLPTPFRNFTHGIYCDDFAESHTKDIPARQFLGGFIPSSGVGTGFTRPALEELAASESNRIFESACLTEDYENGLRLHRLGRRQVFVPIQMSQGEPVATREFFPRRFRWAVKQRTRWVTGIALQTWERHGWGGGLRQLYWLWRDRKAVIGAPVSLMANMICLYGAGTWIASRLSGAEWGLAEATPHRPILTTLLAVNLVLLVIHLGIRMACVARIYGVRFSLGVPLRTVCGNCLNSISAALAVYRYTRVRLLREPLVWVKTEHAYPSRAALLPHKRPLEEILVGSSYLTGEQLAAARASKPRGVRLGEHLVHCGALTEDDLYEALSLQLGLALDKVEPNDVPRRVARALPAHVFREWNVLPVRIESGNLHLASPEVPTDELQQALRRFTRLEIRVQLITPTNFRRLSEQLL